MGIVMLLLFAAAFVLGLLASVGVTALGPFATAALAIACIGGGLFTGCWTGSRRVFP